MVLYSKSTTTGTVLQLPIFTIDERQKIKDMIKSAKDIRDKDTEGLLSDIIDRVDSAEATMRNLYRTLGIYRNRIPKIIKALNEKKREV